MTIQSCLASIIGPTNICNTSTPVTYTLGGFGSVSFWSVSPGERFEKVSTTATTCTIKALVNDGGSGAVVAITDGWRYPQNHLYLMR